MNRALTFLRNRVFLAIVTGLLWALAFPKWNVAGFAWIAPGLLLFAARGESGKTAFRIGYIAGLTFWLTSLYWLLLIPYRWHGIPFGPGLGWLALSAFLALYPATWVWLATRIQHSTFNVQHPTSNWLQRANWAPQCALLWVALEMVQTRFLSGFPWILLGVSQHKLTPVIQIASITGVYGVSFLVVWFSASLLNCVLLLVEKPNSQRLFIAEIILPAMAIGTIWVWGFARCSKISSNDVPQLKLALIQPSIPQEVIWDSSRNDDRFKALMDLSQKAVAEKPDVLVWPEASMPSFSRENVIAMTNFVASNHLSFIFGADDVEFGSDKTNFFNSAFLFSPEGKYVSTYRKRLLVMFGEYVPLERWFPFLKFVTPIEGGFTPGEKPVQFTLAPLGRGQGEGKFSEDDNVQHPMLNIQRAKTSVLICFEDVFPHDAREHVESDTDFLLNLTNDGWFGNSAAQWQQAMTALFRAVENGVPLVRCTNNGLTCWIDQFGRIRDILGKDGNVYAPGFLIVRIPLRERTTSTFYNQHGDLFGWSCVVIAAGVLVQMFLLGKR